MIDHFTLKVSNYKKSRKFYLKALKPLGYKLVMEYEGGGGFGAGGKPDIWLSQDPKNARPTHFAIAATSRKVVDAFYRAATGSGGKDNGPPGVREDYHPTYYAAFVIDPDGHNVEAVCHRAR
jgi:catechol 2,3-dioxygenase-like lactoylglutathione lyase family enzyme